MLATHPHIYYRGANWHSGEPAGGYCGIQHNGPRERRTIFSIWDTAPDLHPRVTAVDPATIFNRFGGEGEGAHTHMLWPWKERETFSFFVQKRPGAKAGTTDARYFVFDRGRTLWLPSATITCPDGGKRSAATPGGGLTSFLENFAITDKEVPKLALYRLWLGPEPGPHEGTHPGEGRRPVGPTAQFLLPGRGRRGEARGRLRLARGRLRQAQVRRPGQAPRRPLREARARRRDRSPEAAARRQVTQ